MLGEDTELDLDSSVEEEEPDDLTDIEAEDGEESDLI